jgi:choline kinase
MQAIVMAAGMGIRLGSLTENKPKALIEVAGRTLIDRALEFARWAGASHRAVVGGFCYAELAAEVQRVDPAAVLRENADYRQGNLLSLQAGLPALQPGGFLLMNTDHIYPRAVAELVGRSAASAVEVTAFCDFDRTLGADDMKVELDGQRRVVAMSKQLARWDAGYVGMTFVPAARRGPYLEAVAATRQALGEKANVESVLVQLADAGARPAIADISGHGWYEVDEPHERDRAEQGLAGRA